MDYTDFVVDRAQHMRPLEYDLSESYNGLVRYLNDMGILNNIPIGTIGPSEIITANDALSTPLRSLVVGGNSVQDGTPTPTTPVPIVSTTNPVIHSGDGTTDTAGWPITMPLTLRSLTDGTRDTATYAYLRPSNRAGWAWYSGEVTRHCGLLTMDGSWNPFVSASGTYTRFGISPRGTLACIPMADKLVNLGIGNLLTNPYGIAMSANDRIYFSLNETITTTEQAKNWLTYNPVTVQYAMATPTVEQLEPIELPSIIGPSITLWGTANITPQLTAQYVRDISAAINDMQEAIADI